MKPLTILTRLSGLWKKTALAVTLAILAGCVSVPTNEFNSYVNGFNLAKTSSQDFLLNAKLAAESIANAPANPASPTERVNKLGERRAALDARLDALELISEYNSILVSLASGADPKSVQNQIEGLRDGLSSFGFSKLAALGAKASPYTAVIAEAVSFIDDLIKKQKFKKTVQAGQKPILEILKILGEDADSVQEIQAQLVLLKRDGEETKLRKLQLRIKGLAGQYQSSPELDRSVSRYNEALSKLADSPLADNKLSNPNGAAVASQADLALVQTLVDEAAKQIETFNQYGESIQANQKVTDEYKKLLLATASAFQNLNGAIKSNQRAAIVGFIQQSLQLRQSILQLQQTKTP